MADLPPPTSVASRFVSQTDLDAAQAKRAADWKAAYERIGEEPPKQEDSNEPYDGRSLWEKLQENKNKKQETIDEALKFKNQFRALDQDEISFLDSITEDNTEEEDRRQQAIKEELESFRKAVITRAQAAPPPASLPGAPDASTSASPNAPTPTLAPAPKKPPTKKQKKTLPGLIVKKKALPSKASPSAGVKRAAEGGEKEGEEVGGKKQKVEDGAERAVP